MRAELLRSAAYTPAMRLPPPEDPEARVVRVFYPWRAPDRLSITVPRTWRGVITCHPDGSVVSTPEAGWPGVRWA